MRSRKLANQRRLGIQEAADRILTMTGVPQVAGFARRGIQDVANAYVVAQKIYDEEVKRTQAQIAADRAQAGAGSDDIYDAKRHSEASRRISQAVGPGYAHLFGTAHELQNLTKPANWLEGDILERVGMDLRNNAEGRLAAKQHRPVNPARLQTSLAPGSRRGGGYSYRRGLNF